MALESVTSTSLNHRKVIGRLGVPLGVAVEIDATIVSGDTLRMKVHSGRYLLKVETVQSKPVNESLILTFEVPPFVDAPLAIDHVSLVKLKRGKISEKLNSQQIKLLEQGYVGQRFRLLVYETGSFTGIPSDLPSDAPIWQDTGFHFATYLKVLAHRKPN